MDFTSDIPICGDCPLYKEDSPDSYWGTCTKLKIKTLFDEKPCVELK